MAKVLTKIAVEKAQGAALRREIPDGALPGLYLVVQPAGGKSWAVRYRIGRRSRKHTLGTYPTVDLVTARSLAGAALRAVAEGRDPSEERKIERRRTREGSVDTVEGLALRFLERHARRHCREKTRHEYARLLGYRVAPEDPDKLIRSPSGGEVLSRWAGRSIRDIRRVDVIDLLDGIVDRGAPVSANRTFGVLQTMFAWAVSRDLLAASPCSGVKKVPESSRGRVLNDAELGAVWEACDTIGCPFGSLVQLLILTGQRRGEVAGMTWGEVDLETAVWSLPPARTKNNRAHTVPLPPAATKILRSLPRVENNAGYVFGNGRAAPISALNYAKTRLDQIVADALGTLGSGWCLHDIRRTAATGMAERLGVTPHVVEAVLNHVSGHKRGVAGIYNHATYEMEKRQALARWADYVLAIAESHSGGVVPPRIAIVKPGGET
jgi:integrase